MASRNPVLHLYHVCSQIAESDDLVGKLVCELEGRSPPSLIGQIKTAVSALTLEDLGIDPRNMGQYFPAGAITQVKVFSSDELWIGLFCMREGLGFPLHDHPSMTAFTYLLHGRMQIVSFDRVQTLGPGLLKVRLSQNLSLSAPSVLSLSHEKDNLHEILALEPSVFLDIFMPFYGRERPCNYYSLVGQMEGEFFVMQCEEPRLPNTTVTYSGLPIQ